MRPFPYFDQFSLCMCCSNIPTNLACLNLLLNMTKQPQGCFAMYQFSLKYLADVVNCAEFGTAAYLLVNCGPSAEMGGCHSVVMLFNCELKGDSRRLSTQLQRAFPRSALVIRFTPPPVYRTRSVLPSAAVVGANFPRHYSGITLTMKCLQVQSKLLHSLLNTVRVPLEQGCPTIFLLELFRKNHVK